MTGYRLAIASDDWSGDAPAHFSGWMDDLAVRHACPNCGRPLFPVFNLSFRDERLAGLGVWAEPYAHVLVCPACGHYMAPYFIHHSPLLSVSGGHLDGGRVLQDVDLPYRGRAIMLESLVTTADVPLHQVGGPEPGRPTSQTACPSCGELMGFFGIVDYDDLNVPLSEAGGSPVALVIGDMSYLKVRSCTRCSVLSVELESEGRPTRG